MSFPRYPHYKASGVEWLGEVPEHWELCLLKRSFSAIDYGISDSLESEGEVAVLRMGNIVNGKIVTNDLKYIYSVDDALLLKDNDLLFNRTNSLELIGKVGLFAGNHCQRTTFASYLVRLRTKASCLPQYYAYLLNTEGILGVARASAFVSIGQCNLNPTRYGLITVAVPPQVEQSSIATFLDDETAKIDALVAEQQRLIELLKEKRQAVISHAVTKGLDPTVPMKPSGIEWLGDIPAHWTLARIKHLACSIEQGWSPQCEGFPVETDTEWGVLKVGCVNGGIFNPLENKALPPELEPVPSLSISAGDLLVSRANTRELVGSSAVPQRNHPNLLLCDKIYRIKLHKERVLPEFVSYYLGCTPVRGQIELGATGASSSMVNIGQSVILELSIAIASIEEQSQILSSIQREIVKLGTLTAEAERAIELLQERRTALISAAVTGQIDVRQLAQGVAA